MASRRSRPLPCGTPSMMSMRTTSASSFDAIQWAAVAPTFPDPTMLTFFRMISFQSTQLQRARRHTKKKYNRKYFVRLRVLRGSCLRRRHHSGAHILDNCIPEFAGADLGGALHQTLEVVGNRLLFDRSL